MYYAVKNGKNVGIFDNWDECKESISGYSGSIFKKFKYKSQAEEYLDSNKKKKIKKIDDFFSSCKEEDKEEDKDKEEDNNNDIIYVYTDGACIHNGRENAKAGIGIYFGENDSRNVSERIDGKQTNNTAELKAIIKVYDILQKDIMNNKKIKIYSDSTYSINCATNYRKTTKSNGTEIPNKELVEQIYNLYRNYPNVEFIHIKAHTNNKDIHSLGNEQADLLANKAIGLDHCIYNTTKIYLNVPFRRKDEIKKIGGKWDKTKTKWFIYDNNPDKEYILSTFG